MKMRVKPLVVDVIEDDGMWLEPYTMTYYDKDSLEPIDEYEVDLEKELDQWRHKHFKGKRDGGYYGEYLERESQLDIARHFYELGLKARK